MNPTGSVQEDPAAVSEENIPTGEAPASADPVTGDEMSAEPTQEPEPEIYNIQLWVPPQFDPSGDNKAGKALSSAISAYIENHPNVEISIRIKASTGESSMVNTIIAADHVAKDVLPTLALMSRSDMETSAQRNMLRPITSDVFYDSSTWYNFAKQSALVDNTMYGIPILGDGLVMIYRISKIGAELGDWQDILSRGLPIGFTPSSSTSVFGTFMYSTMGGKIQNEQGLPSLDQNVLLETLKFFQNGGHKGTFPPSIAQLVDQSQLWQRFNDGALSIIISSFSNYRHHQMQGITMHPLPLQETLAEYPLVTTWNLVLLESNPDIQAIAIDFAEYLCEAGVNDQLSVSAGYMPVRTGSHDAWEGDPQADIVNQMSEYAVLVPSNSITGKIYPVINNAVTQIIKNQVSPEDAAKEALTSLN